ncbi:hypothetical protein DXG01_014750 [Tephrocybe rancida]|nr:hypothetical protein DXG01_014750 [Tephrocybe rancida]
MIMRALSLSSLPLSSLDTFLGQLLPLPPSGIDASGSTIPSQAKRPHNNKGDLSLSSPPSSPPRPAHTSAPRAPRSDKRPAKRRKVNPFLDIEAEEDTREDADILDDMEGESEFDNFIDNRTLAPDEEPPMAHSLIDEAEKDAQRDGEVPGEEDEDLGDEEYSDNEYPPTAAAISHKALASHGNMEQWRSLLVCAYERAHEHQATLWVAVTWGF